MFGFGILGKLAGNRSPLQPKHTKETLGGGSGTKGYTGGYYASENEDDPLALSYAYLTEQHRLGQENAADFSKVARVAEETAVKLLNDPRYKRDPRYLQVWLYFAEHATIPKPEIFDFLFSNDIGVASALLYEQYALALEEADTEFEEVIAIYLRGIDRRAQPLDRLVSSYKSYCERMGVDMTRITRSPRPQHRSTISLPQHWPIKAHISGSMHKIAASDVYDSVKDSVGSTPFQKSQFNDGSIMVESPLVSRGLKRTRSLVESDSENQDKGQAHSVPSFSVFRDDTNSAEDTHRQTISKGRRPEVLKVDLRLMYNGDVEYCFEEIRALRYVKPSSTSRDEEADTPVSSSEEDEQGIIESSQTTYHDLEVQLGEGSQFRSETENLTNHSERSADSDSRHRTPASPTIHTKAAMADIISIFNGPLNSEKQDAEANQQQLYDDDYSGNVVLANGHAAANKQFINIYRDEDDMSNHL
ncbi:hypothetical protein BZG36_02402 [Bifiguratus adelaidae]|uniref:BUB1 N-terminal domain-containing protein n=1 Tax=Bifiguratus adelaidae TaxID=1938954 RepID=A0A261Y1A2_9FUNG|nr:hypothetical protein BZG36_02402 [Bifiguratus adelaidae]